MRKVRLEEIGDQEILRLPSIENVGGELRIEERKSQHAPHENAIVADMANKITADE